MINDQSILVSTFNDWCKKLPGDRFAAFVAWRKFAAACLLYHNVDIKDGKDRWSADNKTYTVCDGVVLTNVSLTP